MDTSSCRVDVEMQVELSGFERVVAPLLARMLRRRLSADLQRLADLSEAQSQPSAHYV